MKSSPIQPGNRKAEAGTFASRLIILACTLGIVLLNTHYLGTAGQGTASLVNLGILLIVALSNFIGGGALAYLIPRIGTRATFIPSVLWAGVSTLLLYGIFMLYPIVPGEYILYTCLLGLLQSLFIYFLQVLVANMQFTRYNIAVSIQSCTAFLSLLLFFLAAGWNDPMAFIASLGVSFAVTFCVSLVWVLPMVKNDPNVAPGNKKNFLDMFHYGKFVQGGNITHLLNQRLNFVLLENLAPSGRLLTGIFSLAMYAAEATWTIAKSLSLVQYSRISNSGNPDEHHALVRRNVRIALLVAVFASLVIAMVPESLYQWIFGSNVDGLRWTLLLLIPAIVANSFSIIYAHYFSGIGLHRFNMLASGTGLVLGLTVGLLLIPPMGLKGAAIASSIAFVAQAMALHLWYTKEKRKNQSR